MRVPALIRRFTDPVLERLRVPIISGENRGRWWNLASAGSGYMTGRRASAQVAFLSHIITDGDVVWDIGAHHGFVTLLAAARCAPSGQVHAFEPSIDNARILERHVQWNDLGNVSIHRIALSARNGEARFGGGDTSKMYALDGGNELVTVRTAESLVLSGEASAPTVAKIDVEGAEGDVLRGLLPVLPANACLLVAIHGAAVDDECVSLLREHKFTLVPTRALEQARGGAWNGDPDLFCMGPDYPRPEAALEQLRATGLA